VEEKSGGFYKMIYDSSLLDKPMKTRPVMAQALSKRSIETGKQLFAEAACLACHSVDGAKEFLGPNLNGIGKRSSREEILEAIQFPSKIITPSMGASRITKKDGQTLLGRVVSADESQISIMLVGNSVTSIPRSDIEKTEDVQQSLMYEGLIGGLTADETNSLLDYILSLQ
jgi:putative heme-binding domain-containing protein